MIMFIVLMHMMKSRYDNNVYSANADDEKALCWHHCGRLGRAAVSSKVSLRERGRWLPTEIYHRKKTIIIIIGQEMMIKRGEVHAVFHIDTWPW